MHQCGRSERTDNNFAIFNSTPFRGITQPARRNKSQMNFSEHNSLIKWNLIQSAAIAAADSLEPREFDFFILLLSSLSHWIINAIDVATASEGKNGMNSYDTVRTQNNNMKEKNHPSIPDTKKSNLIHEGRRKKEKKRSQLQLDVALQFLYLYFIFFQFSVRETYHHWIPEELSGKFTSRKIIPT